MRAAAVLLASGTAFPLAAHAVSSLLSTDVPVIISTKTLTCKVYPADDSDTGEPVCSGLTHMQLMPTTSAAQSSYRSTSRVEPCSTPVAAATSAAATPVRDARPYLAVVDQWRAKMNLKPLARSTRLEANAMDTVMSGNGRMVHKLNSGTFGQVLAPGTSADFEHVFVGGWLCEMPRLPGLQGVCETESIGWDHRGQTGHAEILSSEGYSDIGCALHLGIWCCDVA